MSRAQRRFTRTNPPLPVIGTTNGAVVYKLSGILEGQITLCTFGYTAAVPAPTPAQLTNLLAAISGNILTKFLACVSADWVVNQEQLAVVHRNDLMGATLTSHAGNAGTRTAGHLPTEVALPIIKFTAVKGQHGRGRVSLPAIALADVTASKVSAVALTTALGTLMGATGMLAVASDGTNAWSPAVLQRSPVKPGLAIGAAVLTSCSASGLLGTIRRRKIGRGK